ncbi:hypothetical protein ACEQ8H_007038 [Pleosporales sp. CAS-2024a]
MHSSETPSRRHSARISLDATAGISESQPLLSHGDGNRQDAASRRRSITQWDRHVEPSLATVQPHVDDMVAIKNVFLKQILGLNPFKTSYFALYRPLDDFRSRAILALGVLSAMAAGVPLPLIGVILGRIINNFPPPPDELRALLIRLMSVAVGYFVVTWAWAVCWAIIGERVSRRLREKLLHRALGMDMAYFDTVSPDMANILTEKTQTIQLGTSEKVGLFIASISYFISAFAVGFSLNPKLTGVMFVTVIPSMTCVLLFGTKMVSKLSKQATVFTEKASSVAESAIRGVQIVQAFGLFDQLGEEHVHHLRAALRIGIKKSAAGAMMLGSIYFVAYATNALAFWYGDRLRDGSAEAGTIYAVVFLILDASFVLGSFGPFIQTFAMSAAAGQAVLQVLDYPATDIDVYSAKGRPAQKSHFAKDIVFSSVSFVYPARPSVRILDEITLRFQSGQVTGLVGPSGSGKSTVTSLLMRFYDPTYGAISLGQDALKAFNVGSLRSHMALVTQHPILFTGTILENIKLGLRGHLSEEEALAKCKAAAIEAHCDFIERLPDGIHTKIGTGPQSQLSGGQKQRITLARALVGDPALLLLDEFTSAMDGTSEAIVLENLKRSSSASGRTTIIIAHRLATVRNADRIIVMKDGQLQEDGQHDALIQADGVYAELVRAQQFEKRGETSAAPSIVSSSPSGHKEQLRSQDDRKSSHSTETTHPSNVHKMSAGELISRCVALSQKESPAIAIGLLFSIVSGALIIGEAVLFGNLVELLNDTSKSGDVRARIAFYCLLFLALAVTALLSHGLGKTAFGMVSENLVLRVRDVSFRTILQQDIAWFAKPGHSHHALMAKINMDSGSISGLSGVLLGTVFSVATSVLGGIVLAHLVAWKIAIVLLAAVPVMLLAGFLRLRILAIAEEHHQTAYNEAAALASEATSSMQIVAAFGLEKHFFNGYQRCIRKPYEEHLRFSLLGNILLAFSLSVTYFVYSLAYWWGSKQVSSGNYSQKQFFIVLPALLFSAQAAGQLFSLAPEVTRAKAAAQSVFSLHDEKPTIITKLASRVPSTAGSGEHTGLLGGPSAGYGTFGTKGELEFKSVSLFYESRPEVPALHNVSFLIKPGEYVAFVGRSGAGKSSTIHLIERFFDPSSGQVLLDGHDVRAESVQTHRSRLALVEQEPDLFPGTVKFNISLGRRPGTSVSEAEIMTVAKKCELHDFIMSLPEGYNTQVGAHGSKLSGGQRQRLAIARALLRDPEILLLDEATSQLDATTERDVKQAISAASSGRTTIMIAHRLASVQHADRIFVFDAGKIVEQGRHDELVDLGGIYAAMVSAQELE